MLGWVEIDHGGKAFLPVRVIVNGEASVLRVQLPRALALRKLHRLPPGPHRCELPEAILRRLSLTIPYRGHELGLTWTDGIKASPRVTVRSVEPCRVPAGSPAGGQFIPCGGSGDPGNGTSSARPVHSPRPPSVTPAEAKRLVDEHIGPVGAASKATVEVDKYDRKGAEQSLIELFGDGATFQRVADAIGAPDDAVVRVRSAAGDGLRVSVKSPELYEMRRTLFVDADGKRVIHNDELEVRPDLHGIGIGTRILARQVDQASLFGFDRIETMAVRSGKYNGFDTWPKLGYDGELPASVLAKLPANMASSTRVRDLFATAEGRQWWKENGDTFHGVFELGEGSVSRQILDEYQQRHGHKAIMMLPIKAAEKRMKSEGDTPDLSERENDVLDQMWAEMGSKWAAGKMTDDGGIDGLKLENGPGEGTKRRRRADD